MKTITLQATKRDITGKKTSALRTGGSIPAVVYGHGFENQNVAIDEIAFNKAFEAAGESTLVDLAVNGDEVVKILIQDVQRDSVTDRVIHADLRLIRMDEEIETEVPIVFTGVAPAVKELGGVFVGMLDSIHVKVLPENLLHEISLDISKIKTFEDKIYVKDLELGDTVEVLNDPSVLIASVEAPRKEEEEATTGSAEEAEKAAVEAVAGEAAEGDGDKSGDSKE